MNETQKNLLQGWEDTSLGPYLTLWITRGLKRAIHEVDEVSITAEIENGPFSDRFWVINIPTGYLIATLHFTDGITASHRFHRNDIKVAVT